MRKDVGFPVGRGRAQIGQEEAGENHSSDKV